MDKFSRSGVALWLCLALQACAPASKPASDASLVLLVLDALPAHELGCYGQELELSPRLDAFAEQALRFEEVYAPASYTLASMASLFSARAPAAHGVLDLDSNVLPAALPTLAESLAAVGFATAGLSCNPNLTAEAGFDQGFAHFRFFARDSFELHRVPQALFEEARAFWSAHAGERRFLYVHLLPPHQPYDAPAPFGARFGADRTQREEGFTDRLVALDQAGANGGGLSPADPRVEHALARYRAGLNYADHAAGELLDLLASADGLEHTVVVVTSDHGEAFAQHGRLLHGTTAFAEMTRVPLLVRAPGLEPGVARGLWSNLDLAPTLCALLDVPFDPGVRGSEGVVGHSRLEAWRARDSGPQAVALSRSAGERAMWAWRTARWSLVEHPASGATLLFERDADPFEQRDRAANEPLLTAELARTLDERRKAAKALAPQTSAASREHLDALEELGYTGH